MVKPTRVRFFARPGCLFKEFLNGSGGVRNLFIVQDLNCKRANYEWHPASERCIHKYETGIAGTYRADLANRPKSNSHSYRLMQGRRGQALSACPTMQSGQPVNLSRLAPFWPSFHRWSAFSMFSYMAGYSRCFCLFLLALRQKLDKVLR